MVGGNEFKMTLRPTEVGNATYKIQVEKNGRIASKVIEFNSKMPKFNFDVISTPIVVNGSLSQYAYFNYTNMTFLDNYSEHITYTLTPSSSGGTTVAYTPTIMNNIIGVPAPLTIGFKHSNLMMSGTVLRLTITNEFGYSVTKNL